VPVDAFVRGYLAESVEILSQLDAARIEAVVDELDRRVTLLEGEMARLSG